MGRGSTAATQSRDAGTKLAQSRLSVPSDVKGGKRPFAAVRRVRQHGRTAVVRGECSASAMAVESQPYTHLHAKGLSPLVRDLRCSICRLPAWRRPEALSPDIRA